MDHSDTGNKHAKVKSEYFFRALTIVFVLALIALAWPIKVLTDWHFNVSQTTVQAGGTITLHSQYVKHFDAEATSSRFLECKGQLNSVSDYPLVNNYPSYGTGPHSTVTQIVLPPVIPNLPTQCRIYVHTQYLLWGFKPINQENWSNYFNVVK